MNDIEEKRALVRRMISDEARRLRRRDLIAAAVVATLTTVVAAQAGYQYGLSSSQEAGLAIRALSLAEKSNGNFNQAAQYAVQCAHAFSVITKTEQATPATNRRREMPYLAKVPPDDESGIGPVGEAPKKEAIAP